MKKLRINSQTIRNLNPSSLVAVRGGVGTQVRACVTFDPDPNTAGCATTGPWQTEYSCLTCHCLPQ